MVKALEKIAKANISSKIRLLGNYSPSVSGVSQSYDFSCEEDGCDYVVTCETESY